ncbi:MAG: TPM domain-containing protein [Comamonadaceae bacterium]|nr:TPM domain-containing protein [Comamonadaceae bacterium]
MRQYAQAMFLAREPSHAGPHRHPAAGEPLRAQDRDPPRTPGMRRVAEADLAAVIAAMAEPLRAPTVSRRRCTRVWTRWRRNWRSGVSAGGAKSDEIAEALVLEKGVAAWAAPAPASASASNPGGHGKGFAFVANGEPGVRRDLPAAAPGQPGFRHGRPLPHRTRHGRGGNPERGDLEKLGLRSKLHEDQTGNQIAVLTLRSLEGESVEQYALDGQHLNPAARARTTACCCWWRCRNGACA